MIEDLIKLKNQIDTMIETYRDLHPIEHFEASNKVKKAINVKQEKERALKRIREGYYETTFRQEQGKTTTEFSQGQVAKCVLDDT